MKPAKETYRLTEKFPEYETFLATRYNGP